MQALKPCIHCGSRRVQIYAPMKGVRRGILCNECGMQITWIVPESEVTTIWNHLPRIHKRHLLRTKWRRFWRMI